MPLFHHAGALGDFLLALPFLRALRRLFPDAEWTAAASDEHAGLVRLVFPWRRRIAPGSFELAPLSSRSPDSARLGELAARYGGLFGFAPRARAVEAAVKSSRPDLPVALAEPFERAVGAGGSIEEVLADAIARAGGGQRPPGPEDFALAPGELPPPGGLDPLLDAGAGGCAPGKESRLALIHRGAGDPAKRAPASYYDEVASGLEGRGFRVARVRGPVEREEDEARGAAPAAAPGLLLDCLPLVRFAHAVARAQVYIGNDTGPTHLASALGTPTVAVHVRPLAPPPPWRPRGARARVAGGSGGPPEPAAVVELAARLAGGLA